jgi:hypothetical protein
MMKKTVIRNIFYVVALGYVLLGVSLLDWSFNMVPFASSTPVSEIIFTVVGDSVYIAIGLLIFFGAYLKKKNERLGERILQVMFWGGLICLSVIGLNPPEVIEYKLYNLSFYLVLFIPAFIVYLNRRKLNISQEI